MHLKARSLLVLALASCVSGCAAPRHFDYRSSCGEDTRPWVLARALPADIARLRELADANPNLPAGRVTYPVESWFSLPTGEFMLCRSEQAPFNSCSGEWWQFEQTPEGWRIARKDAWICVT